MSSSPDAPLQPSCASSTSGGSENGKLKVPPHYECLGVHPSISQGDLARQYKRLSLQLHPDRAAYRSAPSQEREVQARFQAITAAYAVLSDPQLRAAYDTHHGVNFQSRVATMQARILAQSSESVANATMVPSDRTTSELGSSSVSATKKQRTEENTLAKTHIGSKDQRRQVSGGARDEGEDGDDDDDDDEEYVPQRSHLASDAQADKSSQQMRRHFSLYPRSHHHHDHSCGGDGNGILKRVQLYPRRASTAESGKSGLREDDHSVESILDRYGLVIDKNRLLRAAVPDVPFPALITIVNGTAVDAADNVSALIAHKVRTMGRHTSERVPALAEESLDDDGALPSEETARQSQEQTATGATTAIIPPPSDTALELTLCYDVESFDLVGDLSLLANPENVDALLAHPADKHHDPSASDCSDDTPSLDEAMQPAELQGMRAGSVVVSVNGQSIESLRHLRDVLVAHFAPIADADEDCEIGQGTTNGRHHHRRPKPLWMEFASIDSLLQ